MQLPSFRRIFSTDYPSQFKQLIDTLSVSLNNGIEVLYNALNNEITLEDNIACTVKQVTLQVDSTGKPTQGGAFTLNNNTQILGVVVLSAINNSNSNAFVTGAPFITGTQSGTTYTINNITGLQPNVSYILNVMAFESA